MNLGTHATSSRTSSQSDRQWTGGAGQDKICTQALSHSTTEAWSGWGPAGWEQSIGPAPGVEGSSLGPGQTLFYEPQGHSALEGTSEELPVSEGPMAESEPLTLGEFTNAVQLTLGSGGTPVCPRWPCVPSSAPSPVPQPQLSSHQRT